MKKTIKVRCYRGGSQDGAFQEYQVPVEGETSVQEILTYISESLDPTLTFFKHAACKQGLCGRCTVRMNGKACLACTTPVPAGDEPVTLEPVIASRVVRDLLCRVEAF